MKIPYLAEEVKGFSSQLKAMVNRFVNSVRGAAKL
tara:strand:+ start:146 stop:250 length:105 start_codon:yes stop_codon:yes gene_type:complete